jgi:uncharacterized protein YecT (DUF1311 family)
MAEAFENCDGGTGQEMQRCFGEWRHKAVSELNKIYGQLKADLLTPEDLVKAQRAWSAYRDAECGYRASGYACDTGIAGMCSLTLGICEMKLNCDRVKVLLEHMKEKCNGCPARKDN